MSTTPAGWRMSWRRWAMSRPIAPRPPTWSSSIPAISARRLPKRPAPSCRLRRLKTEREAAGGQLIIAVAGCVAQAEGREILTRAPFVDLVVGPQAYHRLPELLARATRAGGGVLDTEFPIEPKFDQLPEAGAARGASAFLSVQEGCDKF